VRVLINGDDIGFVANAKLYNIWQKIVPQVGLTPSPGKNYASRTFITLNSQCYIPHKGNMKKLPWVNLGLLAKLGKSKSSKKDFENKIEEDECPLNSLGPMHDEFVSGCPNPKIATGIFIHEHKDELQRTFKNLHGPVRLGGLGAKLNAQEERLTEYQLMLALLVHKDLVKIQGAKMDSITKREVMNFQSKIRSFVKEHYVQDEEPINDSDVTERVENYKSSLRSMITWKFPVSSFCENGNDWKWAKKVSNLYKKIKLDKMSPSDYLNAPCNLRLLICSKVSSCGNGPDSSEEQELH
jgi:hypothetical protein